MTALPEQVIDLLRERGFSLATAESLTGGRLAAEVTGVPGSSKVFLGGVVSYATEVKQSVLGVPDDVVRDHGVVSAQCAQAMASGVRDLMGADVAVATTGVAGPDRQEDKRVGTVFLGLATASSVTSRRLALTGSRSEIVRATVAAALTLVLEESTSAGDHPREEPSFR